MIAFSGRMRARSPTPSDQFTSARESLPDEATWLNLEGKLRLENEALLDDLRVRWE